MSPLSPLSPHTFDDNYGNQTSGRGQHLLSGFLREFRKACSDSGDSGDKLLKPLIQLRSTCHHIGLCHHFTGREQW